MRQGPEFSKVLAVKLSCNLFFFFPKNGFIFGQANVFHTDYIWERKGFWVHNPISMPSRKKSSPLPLHPTDRVSLCNPGWLQTSHPLASASWKCWLMPPHWARIVFGGVLKCVQGFMVLSSRTLTQLHRWGQLKLHQALEYFGNCFYKIGFLCNPCILCIKDIAQRKGSLAIRQLNVARSGWLATSSSHL
jgi:hypothetical protein